MAVSQALLEAFGAPSRQVGARAVIDFTGQFESRSAEFSSSQAKAISRMSELGDGSGGMSCKYALLDGRWVLGGGFGLAHHTAGHIGFISEACSRQNGEFSPSLLITVSFDAPQKLSCITIIADDMREEYPVDFELKFFNGKTLMASRAVTGNSCVRALAEGLQVSGCTSIHLAVYRWSHADTPAKLAGIAFSPIAVYDKDLIHVRLVESDGAGSGIVTGSVASRSVEFTAADNSGRLSALSQGELSGYLLPNRRVRIYWGAKVDGVISYTLAGVFYTDGWEAEETGPVVRLSGMDILSLLDDIPFADRITYPCTLRRLAEDIFAQADMNLTVSVDPFFSSVSLIFPPVWGRISLRRALCHLMEATFFRAKTLPDGTVALTPLDCREELSAPITADNAFSIRITGEKRQMVNHVRIYAADGQLYEDSDQNSIRQNGPALLTVRGNPVIEDYNWAAWLGQRLMAYYSRARVTADTLWRGDPRVSPGCLVSLSGKNDLPRALAVTSQTVEYDGGLKAATKGEIID